MSELADQDGVFSDERKRPWRSGTRGLGELLEQWRCDGGTRSNTVLDETLPPRAEISAAFPAALSEPVRRALDARGVRSFYSHQARAFELATAGKHFVVATPTASGKSLCYNAPILDRLAQEPSARALYLFPTKALSRDQEEALRALMRDAGLPHGAITYDGDTPGDARRVARERAGVLLTNPDMLHTGILPHHANWARVMSNLRYVVVDELHTYRGVFGSHLANVLRRLQRIAAFHGASPTFIFASATIGNPKEHAERMLGQKVELIDESGAPAGPRTVMVYNPPVVNAELGIRQSYIKAATRLAADLVRAEVPTILFGQSRNSVEMMLKYLRDRLRLDKIDPNTIHAYRGGYLPETRRRIEAGLRSGEVRCVVATSALELGIDIGSLDAVVCAGFPGSIAGLWQRWGRGGRRGEKSLALMVSSSAPLDQYLCRTPKWLVGAPVEEARIDPDNVEVLIQHLKCAAFELPFTQGERFGDVRADVVEEALEHLAKEGLLHPNDSSGRRVYHWAADSYPANHVSLRSVGWDNFVIIDLDSDRTIAEMDWRSVHTMLHEQAIYQQEGEQYQVERLDFDDHKGYVRKVKPDYYTDAMTHTKLTVTHEDKTGIFSEATQRVVSLGVGEVSVVEKVVGYKKVKFHTHENVGYGDVRLPEMQMHTSAAWITFSSGFVESFDAARPEVIDALRSIGTALHTVASVGLMIDPRDLGHTLQTGDQGEFSPGTPADLKDEDGEVLSIRFDPRLYLYDHIPGGVGLAPRLFAEREALMRRARVLIEGCQCEEGCPACIGPDSGAAVTNALATPVRQFARKALTLEVFSRLGVTSPH